MNHKYLKYKYDYINLHKLLMTFSAMGAMNGGTQNMIPILDKNIIFIVGYAGSGKSSLAIKYKVHGYHVISADEIIRNQLDGAFGIYKDDMPKDLDHYKKTFIKIMKEMIKKHKRVIIEGQLNAKLIRSIDRSNGRMIIFVKPQNERIYREHLISRFLKDPVNYGRIGFLKGYDDKSEALKDFEQNGINGTKIKALFDKAIDNKYKKHQETYEYYKKYFNDIIIYNSV